MTRKATAVVIILALLTLSGFILVSNLMGARRPENKTPQGVAPQPQSTGKHPSVPITPLPPSSDKTSQDEGQLHADLVKAQELLNAMATATAANDWTKAQQSFTEFESKTQHLPAPQLRHPDISPVLQDFFALYAVQLERAIAKQDAAQANFALNQLYGIVGEQRARLGTRGLPLEFQRLRFLVREIELWGQADDEKMLRVRAVALRDAWSRDVRPIIAARRAGAEMVRNFDQLVQQLSAAEQTHQVTILLPEFNRELEKMDTLFQQRARPANGSRHGKPVDDD